MLHYQFLNSILQSIDFQPWLKGFLSNFINSNQLSVFISLYSMLIKHFKISKNVAKL